MKPSVSKNLQLVILLGLIVTGVKLYQRSRASAQAGKPFADTAALSQESACHGKERCVVAYMAPWCGACKAVLPGLLTARDQFWKGSSTRGMRFYVGQGTPETDQEMAKRIGGDATVDSDMEIARKLKVKHFPTIWVLDQAGKVLAADREAIDWLNRDLASLRK